MEQHISQRMVKLESAFPYQPGWGRMASPKMLSLFRRDYLPIWTSHQTLQVLT